MSVDALALALVALDDDGNRTAIAAGDLGCLEDTDLTDEELELLNGAAQDNPEVEGFAFADSPTFRAVDYVRINQGFLSAQAKPIFVAQIRKQYGGIDEVSYCGRVCGPCGD